MPKFIDPYKLLEVPEKADETTIVLAGKIARMRYIMRGERHVLAQIEQAVRWLCDPKCRSAVDHIIADCRQGRLMHPTDQMALDLLPR